MNEQYEQASVHLWDLLEGKEKPVCGTTCKYGVCMERQHTKFVPKLKHSSDVRELRQLIKLSLSSKRNYFFSALSCTVTVTCEVCTQCVVYVFYAGSALLSIEAQSIPAISAVLCWCSGTAQFVFCKPGGEQGDIHRVAWPSLEGCSLPLSSCRKCCGFALFSLINCRESVTMPAILLFFMEIIPRYLA